MAHKIVNPARQIAKIMRKDAELIDDSTNINSMLKLLSDNNVKIHMILKGLNGDVN